MAKLGTQAFAAKYPQSFHAYLGMHPESLGKFSPSKFVNALGRMHISGDWTAISGKTLNLLTGRKPPKGSTRKAYAIFMAD